MLSFIFYLLISPALACICYRQIDTPEEYEWLLNSVGIGSFTPKQKHRVIDRGQRRDVKEPISPNTKLRDDIATYEQEVDFELRLIIVTPEERHQHDKAESSLMDHMWVKFIPQTPCSILCVQSHSSFTEKWTIQNHRIVDRQRFPKVTAKEGTEQDSNNKVIEHYWRQVVFTQNSFFEKLYNTSAEKLSGGDKSEKDFSIVEPEDRSICCNACCNQFIHDMNSKLKAIKELKK